MLWVGITTTFLAFARMIGKKLLNGKVFSIQVLVTFFVTSWGASAKNEAIGKKVEEKVSLDLAIPEA